MTLTADEIGQPPAAKVPTASVSVAGVPAGKVPATVAATPYPWPYHGLLDPRRTALVACLDGRWRAGRPASDESDGRLVELAIALGRCGGLVIAVTAATTRHPREDDAAPGGPVAPGRLGAADRPPPTGLAAHVVVEVVASSAFYASPLEDVLRAHRRADLVLAGWGLEGPVHSTMRAANDRGYECLLVPDASTPVDSSLAFAACEMVRFSGGIFGAFADTADLVSALGRDPDTRSTT